MVILSGTNLDNLISLAEITAWGGKLDTPLQNYSGLWDKSSVCQCIGLVILFANRQGEKLRQTVHILRIHPITSLLSKQGYEVVTRTCRFSAHRLNHHHHRIYPSSFHLTQLLDLPKLRPRAGSYLTHKGRQIWPPNQSFQITVMVNV